MKIDEDSATGDLVRTDDVGSASLQTTNQARTATAKQMETILVVEYKTKTETKATTSQTKEPRRLETNNKERVDGVLRRTYQRDYYTKSRQIARNGDPAEEGAASPQCNIARRSKRVRHDGGRASSRISQLPCMRRLNVAAGTVSSWRWLL
jgi:hypothetical protein